MVITQDGRVQRSPVPEGFSPKIFRHICACIDVLYRRNGVVPTVNEVIKEWPDFELSTVRKAYVTPELKLAMQIRGIELNPKAGLSAEQLYAITALQDPSSQLSVKARLDEIGISMAKYRAWMRNPLFAGLMNSQAEQNLGDAVQVAINRLISKADAGDMAAINKVLEMSGRWNPQQQELQNARTVILMFMEVIQSEIKDKELLDRIQTKLQGKMQAMSIVQGLKELN